jgi:hypothetical protein
MKRIAMARIDVANSSLANNIESGSLRDVYPGDPADYVLMQNHRGNKEHKNYER